MFALPPNHVFSGPSGILFNRTCFSIYLIQVTVLFHSQHLTLNIKWVKIHLKYHPNVYFSLFYRFYDEIPMGMK